MVNEKIYGRKDARSLNAEAQETIRSLAVEAVVNGMKQIEAARLFGVSRRALSKWMRAYRENGRDALASKPKGRPKGGKLLKSNYTDILNIFKNSCPDELGLPFHLWSREAVKEFLKKKYRINYSLHHIGRYQRAGGFDQGRPLQKALDLNTEGIKIWLKEEYPLIKTRARDQKAEIHVLERRILRPNTLVECFYSETGHNIISTLTNQGMMRFMVYKKPYDGDVLLNFLNRLVKEMQRKTILIVDRHPAIESNAVRTFVYKHIDQIELYQMPRISFPGTSAAVT